MSGAGEPLRAGDNIKKEMHTFPSGSSGYTLHIRDDIGTLAADHAKILFDGDCRTCTILLFRKHVVPKLERGNVLGFEKVVDEAFLEIKMPFETTYALGLGITQFFEQFLPQHPEFRGQLFGPGRIEQTFTGKQ